MPKMIQFEYWQHTLEEQNRKSLEKFREFTSNIEEQWAMTVSLLPWILPMTKVSLVSSVQVQVLWLCWPPAALFYERNKQQLLSNWEDRLAKSLIYVAVVLLLYILLVVITIIHDTYSVCGISEKRSNVSTLVLFIDKIYQDFFHFFIDCFPYS